MQSNQEISSSGVDQKFGVSLLQYLTNKPTYHRNMKTKAFTYLYGTL